MDFNYLNIVITVSTVFAVVVLSSALLRRPWIQKLPVPQGSDWIWGHEKQVFMAEPGRKFRDWVEQVGLTYRIKAAFGAPDVLLLSDPGGISHILQKKIYDYHHSDVVRPRVARLLGKGLGWVEGETEHRRMRRLVTPALSSENLKDMSSTIWDAASAVLNDMVQVVHSNDGPTVMNVLDWTGKFTLNMIGKAIFQHDFEGGNSEEAQNILNARRKGVSPIARYAGFITLMLLRRFPVLNDLPISAIQAQSFVKSTIQSGVAREMVKRNQAIPVQGTHKTSKDLLDRLLIAKATGNISTTELYEQISTFVVSGHETTTQTLGFAIWELARHPEIQQRLRHEVSEFPGEPSYDDFQSKLTYLDAVLRETLRLYPGLPYMERVATKPDVIPLREPVVLLDGQTTDRIIVDRGQTVLIPIMAIHRLDSVWQDADEFHPERWLGDLPATEKLCSGWSNTLAFSDGPRSCVGMRLAIFNFKVVLMELISRFNFKDTGTQIELRVASSLQPWVVGETERGPQLPVEFELL